jgi:hypothetical protein
MVQTSFSFEPYMLLGYYASAFRGLHQGVPYNVATQLFTSTDLYLSLMKLELVPDFLSWNTSVLAAQSGPLAMVADLSLVWGCTSHSSPWRG